MGNHHKSRKRALFNIRLWVVCIEAMLLMAMSFAVTPVTGVSDTIYYELLRTFPNPNPDVSDGYDYEDFGFSLAVLSGNILVGNPRESTTIRGDGIVYLFDSQTGDLLQTFPNPTPEANDGFGYSVASVDDDVLVGALPDDTAGENAGAAYLFDSETGNLLQTFLNPTPEAEDWFGHSVASVGDNILVGAPSDYAAGAAYLFNSQTGDLLQTFLNPNPLTEDNFGLGDRFGYSVASVDSNVLVGAPWDSTAGDTVGAAYLFNSQTGDLLQTFLNPSSSQLGGSVASVDGNVLVGALIDNTAGERAGAAYLFDSETGNLLQTFLNPTPEANDWFGHSVASVGDNILVGAPLDDTVEDDAGAAYLFDPEAGELIATILSRSPSAEDRFGFRVTSMDDSVLVSAIFDNTAGTDAGAVFLFAPRAYPGDRIDIWTSSSPNAIKRFDAQTGQFVDDFAVVQGGRPTGFRPSTKYLYVCVGESDKVQRFDVTTGEFIDDFVTAGSGGLDGPQGLDFGHDGNLYVSSFYTNQVKRYNGTTGAYVDDFAFDGGLYGPAWFWFWGSDLYVSSCQSHEVKRYDGDSGTFVENFVTAGSGGLQFPNGLIFQGDGYLYVASTGTNEIKRYDEDTGEFVDNFVTAGSGGLDGPIDLQFYDDYLYVTSYYTDEIKRFDGATGEFVDNFVTAGNGRLKLPQALWILARPGQGAGSTGTWPPDFFTVLVLALLFGIIIIVIIFFVYRRPRLP